MSAGHTENKIRSVCYAFGEFSIELGWAPTEEEVVERFGRNTEEMCLLIGAIPGTTGLDLKDGAGEMSRIGDFANDEWVSDALDEVSEALKTTHLE